MKRIRRIERKRKKNPKIRKRDKKGADDDERQRAPHTVSVVTTTQQQHYQEPRATLVVPPGKGGVDRSLSSVPLCSDFAGVLATPQPHSHTAFTGTQLDELRHTCASRGTLGARGGRKLPRGASGAPIDFAHATQADLRASYK